MEGRNNPQDRKQLPRGARLGMGIVMIIVYLAVGLMFILNIFNIMDRTVGAIIGGLLILYGIFRGYRLYRDLQ